MPRLWGDSMARGDLLKRMGGLEQVAGVRLVTLGDGNERGVRVLEFRTGTGFAFEEHDALGWLRNWGGGLVTTCGLDHALFGYTDTAVQYHYEPKKTETFGLHGRISNRPARLTGYGSRWEGDECVLFAEAEVLQASMFGEHLLLRRRIEATVGANRFTMRDEVENVGWDPTPHMHLYHINVGFPAVDEGAELLVPTRGVTPRGDYPSGGYRTLDAPAPDHYERVYEHDVIAESDGSVPVAIVNRARGIGAYEVFNQRQLPVHFVWRMLGEGSYVVGIEPCTNSTAGRLDAREKGELIILKAGEKRVYDLELGALDGAAEIDAFAARVAALGGV